MIARRQAEEEIAQKIEALLNALPLAKGVDPAIIPELAWDYIILRYPRPASQGKAREQLGEVGKHASQLRAALWALSDPALEVLDDLRFEDPRLEPNLPIGYAGPTPPPVYGRLSPVTFYRALRLYVSDIDKAVKSVPKQKRTGKFEAEKVGLLAAEHVERLTGKAGLTDSYAYIDKAGEKVYGPLKTLLDALYPLLGIDAHAPSQAKKARATRKALREKRGQDTPPK
jgi:hypothetical protein